MAVVGFRHLGLKAVSIVLALLLWFLVSGEQTVERVLRIPLEFTSIPTNLELVGDPPSTAEVRVRGSSGTLGRVSAGELAAVLDVSTARPGLRLFHLTTGEVRGPSGVEVVQVNPATLSLSFEESVTKIVDVTPRIEGEPASGFMISSVRVDPATVAVAGPASALVSLNEAITEAVSVTGASDTVTETVNVGVSNPSVRVLQTQTARVIVLLEQALVEWSVAAVPVQVVNGGATVAVAPEAVVVYVRGPSESVRVGAESFTASVDVAGLTRGVHVRTVDIEAPDGISVLRADPPEVRVTIR